MWFGKKKEQSDKYKTDRRNRTLPDGTTCEVSRIRLNKPVRSAIWGTTTIIGRQKK